MLVLAACEPDINADDYDRSCSQDDDCMVIFTGPVCDCNCDRAAINKSEREAYFEDREGPDCGVACGACQAADAICQGGTCEVTTP